VDVRLGDGDQLRVRAVHVLADDGDLAVVLDAGVDQHAAPVDEPGSVGAEDSRLRHRGQPLPDPDVQAVQRRGPELDEHLARPGLRVGRVFVAQDLGAAVLVDPHGFHRT
jgi:hypothetical protein